MSPPIRIGFVAMWGKKALQVCKPSIDKCASRATSYTVNYLIRFSRILHDFFFRKMNPAWIDPEIVSSCPCRLWLFQMAAITVIIVWASMITVCGRDLSVRPLDSPWSLSHNHATCLLCFARSGHLGCGLSSSCPGFSRLLIRSGRTGADADAVKRSSAGTKFSK